MSADTHPIHRDSFFALSDEAVIHWIHKRFPGELNRLIRAYSVRDHAVGDSTLLPPSPSRILFGADYDEVNRTIVGILALRWLCNRQYDTFVGSQPESVRLTPASFASLRDAVLGAIKTSSDLEAVIVSMVINDLGKDPELAADYRDATGQDISGLNHDMILLKAVEVGLVPALNQLSRRDDVTRGLLLGSTFNLGQLAQAECPPFCLSVLSGMRGHETVFELRCVEQLLDVAGAAGHMDWTCAKKLVEPIHQAYSHGRKAANAFISGHLSCRDSYNLVLLGRSSLLHSMGFRELDVGEPDERALLRLLCLGGVCDLETANLYDTAWSSLNAYVKTGLTRSLNLDGSIEQAAVLPTYMPALLNRGVTSSATGPYEKRVSVLQRLFRYLNRIMSISKDIAVPGAIIERSVLHVLTLLPAGQDFEKNMRLLDSMPIPEGTVW